ncbi:uncharacterized protein BKA78DRAFT_89259 [Phyllosticta capitalensis]|uniref:uncharacterized protein n=1 Tax=Phyllosticta capitalensis TaxID=121624 RepID=UPI00312D00B0
MLLSLPWSAPVRFRAAAAAGAAPQPQTNASSTPPQTPPSIDAPLSPAATMYIPTDPVLITLVATLLPLLGILIYLTHTLTANQRAHLERLSAATAALNNVRDTLAQQTSPAASALAEAVKDLHASLADHASSLTHAAVLQREVADELKRYRQSGPPGTTATQPGHSLLHHAQYPSLTRSFAPSARGADDDADTDIDLYRRKVEALEGLRKVLESNQNLHDMRPGEDEALYRKRVDALEGLWKVLDSQAGISGGGGGGGGGAVAPPTVKRRGIKRVTRARGSVSEVGSRRSEETLAESLMDV